MTKEIMQTHLLYAFDMISKVHSEICAGDKSEVNLADDTMEIIRRIVRLSCKLRGDSE